MRILKDFKIPDFKFKKIEMNDIPNVEDVKVDYSKVMEAQEKKNILCACSCIQIREWKKGVW